MPQFKSELAEAVLREHGVGEEGYVLDRLGRGTDSKTGELADAAYAELVKLGLMAPVTASRRIMPYQGANPQKPFVLTAEGEKVKAALK